MASDWKYDPKTTGIVVVDPVNDFLSEGGKAYPLVKDVVQKVGTISNIKRVLEGSRKNGIKVFYAGMGYTDEDYKNWKYLSGIHKVMYDNRMFEKGTWGADWHPDLKAQPGDTIVAPHKNLDSFSTTDLDSQLRQNGITDVVVCGMSATLCVESTIRSAMEKGYRVTAVKDATAAVGGMESYEAGMKLFPLLTHSVLSTDEFLKSI